jgi:phosphoglycerol transferase MdoB-like AlkP superfamily enzyme
VIIVGDHGHRLPLGLSTHEIKKFKTPLIWLGGALKKQGIVINETLAQADIAPTLMRELGLPHKQYRFGKPFSPNNKNFFAFYAFNNGFGVVKDDDNQFVFDLTSERVLFEKGNSQDLKTKGEAYLQVLSKGMTTR